jgi:hypothetical protein
MIFMEGSLHVSSNLGKLFPETVKTVGLISERGGTPLKRGVTEKGFRLLNQR